MEEQILRLLEVINNMHKLKVWDNLKLIDQVQRPFSVVKFHKQIPPSHIGKATIIKGYDLAEKNDVKKYVLDQLQKHVPYYPNLHRVKKPQLSNHLITIGAGQDGIVYRCSVRDRQNRAFVELYFSHSKVHIYEDIIRNHFQLKVKVDPNLVFGHRKVGVYFNPLSDLYSTVRHLANLFEKMVEYFTPITFPKVCKE